MTELVEEAEAALTDEWADLHELTRRIDGPTKLVYQWGRYVEVPNSASGSGLQTVLEGLVAAGKAEAQADWRAPMGKLYRRAQ